MSCYIERYIYNNLRAEQGSVRLNPKVKLDGIVIKRCGGERGAEKFPRLCLGITP